MAEGVTLRTLKSELTLGTRGWDSGMAKVNADTGRIGGWMQKNSASVRSFSVAMLAAGAAITGTLGLFTKFAMNAEESENLFDVSMGEMAASTRAWSEELSTQLGLNAFEVRRMTGVFNAMFDSMKFGADDAHHMSTYLVELANDMASFYNLPVDVMFQKLQAGITGEIEPLKRLGILINQTTLEQEDLFKSWGKSYLQLNENEKVMLRFNSILGQTKKAQGDLARTFDYSTNILRTLGATAKNIGIEIGNALTPVIEAVGIPMREFLASVLEFIKQNPALVSSIVLSTAAFGLLATALGGLGLALLPVAGFITFFSTGAGAAFGAGIMAYLVKPVRILVLGLIVLERTALIAWAAITSPITLLIAALAGLGIAVYSLAALWRQNTFNMRGQMNELWEWVVKTSSEALSTVGEFFKYVFVDVIGGLLSDAINNFLGFFRGIGAAVFAAINNSKKLLTGDVKGFGIAVLDAFETEATKDQVTEIWQTWQSIGSKTTKTIKQEMDGMWEGVSESTKLMWEDTKNAFADVNWIDDAKKAGSMIVEGISEGLRESLPAVMQQLRLDINNTLGTSFFQDAFTLQDYRAQNERILEDARAEYAGFRADAFGGASNSGGGDGVIPSPYADYSSSYGGLTPRTPAPQLSSQAPQPITVVIQNNLSEEKLSRAVLGSQSGKEGVVAAIMNDFFQGGTTRVNLGPQTQ